MVELRLAYDLCLFVRPSVPYFQDATIIWLWLHLWQAISTVVKQSRYFEI